MNYSASHLLVSLQNLLNRAGRDSTCRYKSKSSASTLNLWAMMPYASSARTAAPLAARCAMTGSCRTPTTSYPAGTRLSIIRAAFITLPISAVTASTSMTKTSRLAKVIRDVFSMATGCAWATSKCWSPSTPVRASNYPIRPNRRSSPTILSNSLTRYRCAPACNCWTKRK